MPTIEEADRFTFIGFQNTHEVDGETVLNPYNSELYSGFPFTIIYGGSLSYVTKVDVSYSSPDNEIEYWTTLGGVTKQNVGGMSDKDLKKKIDLSRARAVKIYWRLYAVRGKNDFVPVEVNTEEHLHLVGADPSGWNKPKDRMKPNPAYGRYGNYAYNGGIEIEFNDQVDGGIVRMYNGPSDDEDNFVGFGLRSEGIDPIDSHPPGIMIANGYGGEAHCYVYICSYTYGLFENVDVAYVEIEGIPFVVQAGARGNGSGELADASAMSAIYYSHTITEGPNTGEVIPGSSVSITGMEFWDPPA